MSQRSAQPPQDFQKMCKQAERDHEERKLTLLIERVKRQIDERGSGIPRVDAHKPPMAVMAAGTRRMPTRLSFFER